MQESKCRRSYHNSIDCKSHSTFLNESHFHDNYRGRFHCYLTSPGFCRYNNDRKQDSREIPQPPSLGFFLCTPRRNNDTVASLLTRDLAPSCLKMWKAETELVYKGASTLFLNAKGAVTLSKGRATASR